MQLIKTTRIFKKYYRILQKQFPNIKIKLIINENASKGGKRQFAYCLYGDIFIIAVSSKIEKLPIKFIEGIILHELAHAIDFKNSEKETDQLVYKIFGKKIEYGTWKNIKDIQCVSCNGKKKRPEYLEK